MRAVVYAAYGQAPVVTELPEPTCFADAAALDCRFATAYVLEPCR